MTRTLRKVEAKPGVGTDAFGGPLIDPTKNVIDLVNANNQRLRELREADTLRFNELRAVDNTRLNELLGSYKIHSDEIRRADKDRFEEIRANQNSHFQEIIALQADHIKELAQAEAKRIDAIRAVDVAAVGLASERAATQATVLANQVACVSADTPILCADLIWRPAGTLLVGDELIAFDEEPGDKQSEGMLASRGRKYRRSTVTANSLRQDRLLLVETSRGAVRCNPEHPWLTRRSYKEGKWIWVQAKDLRVSDEVMHTVDVWEVERTYEAGWLAGILDGEGCLDVSNKKHDSMRLTVVQVDGPIADMIGDAMSSRVPTIMFARKPYSYVGRKPQTGFYVRAKSDLMKLLGSVRPARLLPNADMVWEGKYLGVHNKRTTITSITDAGEGTIASLTTSTKTYIAAGFAMHNTSAETLRTLVATTASTIASQLQAITTTLTDRIGLLERSQYENKGKSAVTDPQFDDFKREVRDLLVTQSSAAGRSGVFDPQLEEMRRAIQTLTAAQANVVGKSTGASSTTVLLGIAVSMFVGIGGLLFAVIRAASGH